MTDRPAPAPLRAAEVIRLHGAGSREPATAGFRTRPALDPEQIKRVLEVHLAGQSVPPAVLDYVLQQVCRLIDEGLLASPSSSRR